MKRARRLLVGVLLTSVGMLTPCAAHAKYGDTRYNDSNFGVSVAVPAGWTVTQHSDGSMLTLHLKRPEAEFKSEDCRIFVAKSAISLRQSQAQINKDFRYDAGRLSVALLLMVGDATVVQSKSVDLRGHATLFAETLTEAHGEKFRNYQVSFGVPGRTFDGVCVSRPAHSAQQKPKYERVLRSVSATE